MVWCSQGFRDPQTHSLTDGQTRMQYASGTVFQRWRRHD